MQSAPREPQSLPHLVSPHATGADAPWLTIVGIGEDGLDGLSPSALRHLAAAEVVVAGRRHLALADSIVTGVAIAWRSPIEDTFPVLLARRGRPTCVLATGDPFFFGIGATLARLVPAAEIQCLPHSSAFSLVAARLGWPLQDCACLSLHGRALRGIVPHLQNGARLIALSWDGTTPKALADLLRQRGFGPSRLTICEAMGGARERVRSGSAETFDLPEVADLNTIAIEVVAGPEAQLRSFAPGMPDRWFAHDGQITKAPMRALTLSALAPHHGERLWDVGAGSGSVGIEWLLTHPSLQAVAIERRSERVARIRANAEHWGVAARLDVVEGSAPDALDALPRPDAIFVGGGPSEPGLLNRCRETLSPGGRLVVNAVTVEGQAALQAAFLAHGGDLASIAMATAEPVGRLHGFRPAMPILQWRYVRPTGEAGR